MERSVKIRCKFCDEEFDYLIKMTLGGSKGTADAKPEKISPLASCNHCGKKAIYSITINSK